MTATKAAILGLTLLLAGCDGFLGESDEGPPLPGERIAILAYDRGVRADPTIADEQVLLAKPYTNKEWSQSGGSAAHSMYHLSLGPSPRIA